MSRIPSCASTSLALLCVALACPAQAQPGGKLIRIVVPFAAGGAREVLARTARGEGHDDADDLAAKLG